MIVTAVAYGDDTHADRLHRTVPTYNLTGPDPEVSDLLRLAVTMTDAVVLVVVDALHGMEKAELGCQTWVSHHTLRFMWDPPDTEEAFAERFAEGERLERDLTDAAEVAARTAALAIEVHRRRCNALGLDGTALLPICADGFYEIIDRHVDRIAAVDLDEDQIAAEVEECGQAMKC